MQSSVRMNIYIYIYKTFINTHNTQTHQNITYKSTYINKYIQIWVSNSFRGVAVITSTIFVNGAEHESF